MGDQPRWRVVCEARPSSVMKGAQVMQQMMPVSNRKSVNSQGL
jgi:hypothetical protein